MSKTDNEIRLDTSINEARALNGAGAVVFGLVLEVALATARSLGYDHPVTENWGAVIADCFVALGVYVEIHFGRIAAEGNSELRKRADERAAKLEKEAADARGRVAEIERLTAWRRISPEKAEQITEELRIIAATLNAHIEYQNGDAEAISYASAIANIFINAGALQVTGLPNSFIYEPMFGVFIATSPEVNSSFIISVFAKGSVEIMPRQHNPLWLAPRRPAPNVRMFVGPKPPPPICVATAADPNNPNSINPISIPKRELNI